MRSVNTSQVMQLALEMAKMERVPADSGIFVAGKRVSRALFSIDVTTAELLLARETGYDLVIAHHPIGTAAIRFPEVVRRHVQFMVEKGVPKGVAEEAAESLVKRIEVRRHPANYNSVTDAARALGMPLMNIHLPIDQITRDTLLGSINSSKAKKVGQLISRLSRLREFKNAATKIELMMGEPENELGNWVLVFAAGTNGGYPVAKAYFEHGVDTVIYLHVDYDELTKLRKECKGNLVVLGHMAGDSIGANLFLSRLRSRGIKTGTIGVIG